MNEPLSPQRLRSRNLRTALVLASVALAFFVGIIVKFVWLMR